MFTILKSRLEMVNVTTLITGTRVWKMIAHIDLIVRVHDQVQKCSIHNYRRVMNSK
jgi:hypothetical protein